MNPYPNLSATTTEDDLMVPVRAARKALAAKATWVGPKGQDDVTASDTLLNYAQAIWEAEAVARAAHDVVGCLASVEGQPDTYRAYALNRCFLRLLANGANDTWSGRANDARRSAHDAVRAFINDIQWSLVPVYAKPVQEV